MHVDVEALSLTDLIRLQSLVDETLKRRFLHPLALVFTDVAGSTPYFARFGDVAGRRLQQRHLDLLRAEVDRTGGRIVDTAGDGAFTVFPTVDAAADACVALARAVDEHNAIFEPEHRLGIRTGVHFGPVLTDGVVVTGDAVNVCARVSSTCAPGEIRLTPAAFRELSKEHRLSCRALSPVSMKGVSEPMPLVVLQWRDRAAHVTAARVAETGEVLRIPDQDLVTFGRLAHDVGVSGNDVVLRMPDPAQAQAISRWHFELRRRGGTMVLRSVTAGTTVVDGHALSKGDEVEVRPGTVVYVGNVMTLELRGEPVAMGGDTTILR